MSDSTWVTNFGGYLLTAPSTDLVCGGPLCAAGCLCAAAAKLTLLLPSLLVLLVVRAASSTGMHQRWMKTSPSCHSTPRSVVIELGMWAC